MSRSRLLIAMLLLVCIVAAMHISALVFSLYWRYIWFDMPTHFLGGVFISLLLLWTCYFSGYVRYTVTPSTRAIFLCMVIGTLLVGIGWEVFERAMGLTWSAKGYWLDTSLDLLMDTLGGITGFIFCAKSARRTLMNNPSSKQ